MRPVSRTSLRPHQSSSSRCMSNIFLHPAVEDAKACGPCRPRIGLVIGKTARGWQVGAPAPCDPAMTEALACDLGRRPMPPPVVDSRSAIRGALQGARLAADAEALDQGLVARFVLLFDVVEQRSALRHHLEQAATRVV